MKEPEPTSPSLDYQFASVAAAAKWIEYAEAITEKNRAVVANAAYFDQLVEECLSRRGLTRTRYSERD